MRLQSILREPLLHFLVIGTALFAYSQCSTSGSSTPANRIVLTAGQIEQLVAGFTKSWKRAPTDAELKSIIDDWVREELAVQAAVGTGLDRGDVVIRRRLRQKFEFFIEDMGELTALADKSLQDWFAANQAKYRTGTKLSFRHVYFSRERRGASVHADAAATLQRLGAEGLETIADSEGDPSLLPRDVSAWAAREVDEVFGNGLSEHLDRIVLGQWTGPIESAYGSHLVFLRERVEGTLPDFASVRAAVERDYLQERRRQHLETAYQALLKKYSVVVEAPQNRAVAPNTGKVGR